MISKYQTARLLAVCPFAVLVFTYVTARECRAQSVNLDAIGISSGFETPDADLSNDAAEQTLARTLSPGWTYKLLGGATSDYGVADEDATFYGSQPLPAPFQGRQVGYFNLEAYSAGEVISDSVGILTAGQTYTLNVAVGARFRTQNDWSNIRYAVGLRSASGTDLGTFTTTDLDSGSAATVISDLAYSLNVDAEAAAFVGQDARIVIRGINLGTGVTPPGFTQANFDNVRLNGTLGAPNRAILTINQSTGVISLSKTGPTNMAITGYSLTSAVGALNSSNWLTIADHYDKPSAPTPGNGSVDANDAWTVLSAAGSKTNFAEGELNFTGNGGTLSNSAINLGNAWRKTPFQDVAGTLTLADGSVIPLDVEYTGAAVAAGDLNGDGVVNSADWTIFKANAGTSFTGLTKAEAFFKGDLNGDLKQDLNDFILFRNSFTTGNGAGSFEALLGVPEPAAGLLMLSACACTFFGTRRSFKELRGIANRTLRAVPALIVALFACGLMIGPAYGQNVISGVAHWSFDSSTQTVSGGNITAIADESGNHNAAPGAGTGGASGTQYVSAAFPQATSSVTGKFGDALQFAGNNYLLFPNLTELMSSAGAPNYSVSLWFKTATNGGGVGSPYATLGNWGNSATGTTTRFTYGFGPTSATQMRGQTRRLNGTDGQDIYARSVTTGGSINDGVWHMMTWTFATSTTTFADGTATAGQLRSYYDGVLKETFQASSPFTMADSASAVGGMGIKADSGTFAPAGVNLDEVYVFKGLLGQQDITNLFNSNTVPAGTFGPPIVLTLRVDPATGQAQLRNTTPGPIDLNSYRITSTAGSLKPTSWTPISSQSISGFPAGNGSGNGWETPPSNANPADYNSSGTVDAADYVSWRKNNINGSAGYDAFRNNFGLTGSGPGTVNEIVEWYLQGQSTLAAGASINLGQLLTVGSTQDLSITYGTATGVTAGIVQYGSIPGAGSSLAAVPEPTAALLLVYAVGIFTACRRSRSVRFQAPMFKVASLVVALVALCVAERRASAAYTVDRLYHFGDDALEGASAGIDVGSGGSNVDPGTTLDSQGPSGAFIDLAVNGATGKPKYIDVSVTSGSLAQARPGASSGNLGAIFDGVDDYLNGLRLNQPNNAPGTHLYTTPGPLNYDGILTRGFQLWVYPNSAGSTTAQHIVMDSRQHGLQTTTGGNWALVYNNTTVNSNVPITFNQWSHVEVAMPGTLPNREVLYVNGVAIAARQSNYSTNGDPVGGENAYALTVGAATGNTVATVGTTNRFNGVVDELQMFVWGSTYDATTNTITNLGQFNYRTDNDYAASHLTAVAGDVNQSGSLTQADIDTFVANWLFEKTVNGVRVGDMTTILKGDLNFDGIVDLSDLALLHSAIAGAGSGASLDVSGLNSLVPEPSTVALVALCLAATNIVRARRRTTFVSTNNQTM